MARRLSGAAVANRILMRVGAQRVARVVVEGNTDRQLFGRLLPRLLDGCLIEVSDGRSNALEALRVLANRRARGTRVPPVAAVVDSDYDSVETPWEPGHGVIPTDGHDAEMMMLKTEALRDALMRYASAKTRGHVEAMLRGGLIERVLKASCELGWFRYASIERGFWLSFSDVDFDELLDQDTLTVDAKRIAERTFQSSRLHGHPAHLQQEVAVFRRQCEERAASAPLGEPDPWQLARGHDTVALLVSAVRPVIAPGGREISTEGLERGLRGAYRVEHFVGTTTHARLVEWARAERVRLAESDGSSRRNPS